VKADPLTKHGLDDAASFASARWELFVFPEGRDLLPWSGRDRFVVLFEGERPDPSAWCRVLSAAGYPAQPIEPRSGTGDAA
jgi:hypothetical protein